MLEVNVGMDKQLSLLLGGAIQVMFVIGKLGSLSTPDLLPSPARPADHTQLHK